MEKLTVLICNREKYEEKTEDFKVLCLTLPIPKDVLIEKMKNLNAKYTLILSYTITGELENMEISSYSNIFGLNQMVQFFSSLDEDKQPEFLACLEFWYKHSYNNIIQRYKAKKFRYFDPFVFACHELGEYLVAKEVDNYYVSDSLYEYLDLESIGENHANKHKGVFTSYGYIEEA